MTERTGEGIPVTLRAGLRVRCSAGRDYYTVAVIAAAKRSYGKAAGAPRLCRTADAGARYGIPTLGVVAVGKQMERTEKFFQLATRVLAENGANVVKSYYCDGFERVAAACPVPIVIAGGKKLPELEALEMAYRAIAEGARGVDMGRNIFQSDCPAGMAQAIGKVVHGGYTAQQAFEVYQEIKNA